MNVGVSAYNLRIADLVATAVAADEAGFSSLWLGEHLVLPCDYEAVHPAQGGADAAQRRHPRIIDLETELLDPFVALSAAAALTSRIQLATGIYLLPMRHPLLTARAAASLADLSGDRFMLGVGSGWLSEEFDAFGIPFASRTGRYEESLKVLRAAFRGGPFEHDGTHYRFRRVQVSPRPVVVPLVLGGNSDSALRRAALLANAWFASGNPTFDEAVTLRARLMEICAEHGRAHIDCHVRMAALDPTAAARYEEAGFQSVLVWAEDICPPGEHDRRAAFRRVAEQFGLQCASV